MCSVLNRDLLNSHSDVTLITKCCSAQMREAEMHRRKYTTAKWTKRKHILQDTTHFYWSLSCRCHIFHVFDNQHNRWNPSAIPDTIVDHLKPSLNLWQNLMAVFGYGLCCLVSISALRHTLLPSVFKFVTVPYAKSSCFMWFLHVSWQSLNNQRWSKETRDNTERQVHTCLSPSRGHDAASALTNIC